MFFDALQYDAENVGIRLLGVPTESTATRGINETRDGDGGGSLRKTLHAPALCRVRALKRP